MVFISCKKEEIKVDNPDKDKISFIGSYDRNYKILGANFVATYTIDSNTIHYSNKGKGPGNTSYELIMDSYNGTDKRWIGHTDDFKYYLIFFKDITPNSVTIYKQKVKNPNDAQSIVIPAASDKKHYGWNTYYRF